MATNYQQASNHWLHASLPANNVQNAFFVKQLVVVMFIVVVVIAVAVESISCLLVTYVARLKASRI